MILSIFLFLCFLASVVSSQLWLQLALARQWFDYPNQRSSHVRPTPKGGGLGFALVFCAVLVLLQQLQLAGAGMLLLCVPGVGLAAVGLWDDLKELGIPLRLCLQGAAVCTALLILPGLPVLPFPGFTVDNPLLLAVVLGLGWVWLINLYNFMDGIDGLAATEGIFVALALGWFALQAGLHGSSLLLLSLAVILAGFLCFNWSPAHLFMGDAGSNFLGYALAAYGLALAQDGAITLWTLVILLMVFITDSTVTLVKRMRAGVVWYHGHRSHAYQLLARAGRSHAKVVVGVAGINVFWLLPLAWWSTRAVEWGAALALAAFIPVLVLVNRCHARFLDGNMQ